jgi:hypothetical protein
LTTKSIQHRVLYDRENGYTHRHGGNRLFTVIHLALHIVFGGLPITPISPITNNNHYSYPLPRKHGITTMSTNNTTIRIDMVILDEYGPDMPAAFLCCGPHQPMIEALGEEDEDLTAGAVKAFIDRWRKEADKLGVAFEVEEVALDVLAELEDQEDGGE